MSVYKRKWKNAKGEDKEAWVVWYSDYGMLNGKLTSRLACEHIYGPAPTLEHEASHTCGKGHLGCVSPRHLVWETHSDNLARKFGHGTALRGEKHHWAKLKDDDIPQIRALAGTMSQREIGEVFGVHKETIGFILRGKTWAAACRIDSGGRRGPQDW
jgi:hypothetical protein